MRRGWAVVAAMLMGATIVGGVAAGCEKRRERVKVIEVRPDRERDRNVHTDRDRRDHDRDHDRRNHDRDRDNRKEHRRDN